MQWTCMAMYTPRYGLHAYIAFRAHCMKYKHPNCSTTDSYHGVLLIHYYILASYPINCRKLSCSKMQQLIANQTYMCYCMSQDSCVYTHNKIHFYLNLLVNSCIVLKNLCKTEWHASSYLTSFSRKLVENTWVAMAHTSVKLKIELYHNYDYNSLDKCQVKNRAVP